MKFEKFFKVDLQLFAEDEIDTENEGVSQNPTDAEGVGQNPTDETDIQTEEESFASMVGKGGRYEQDYKNMVSAAVTDRMKNVMPKAESYDRIAPMLSRLGQKYGVDGTDIDALINAVNNDSGIDEAMYEDEAIENGWTVEHTKEVHRLRNLEAEQQRQAEARRFFDDCHKQADAFRAIVPDFDFDSEFQGNKEFGQLVSSGVSVKNAYFATHTDEFLSSAMKAASQKATQQVVSSVISGQRRINDGASKSTGAASFGIRVEDLTNEQLEEYSRRVLNGERIDFVTNY